MPEAHSALLVVHTEPCDGREEEFNEWYSWVHIRDVMRIPGSQAVQRFVLSDRQAVGWRTPGTGRYLAIYEVGDVARNIEGHLDDIATERMPISDALDTSKAQDTFYLSLDQALEAIEIYETPAESGLVLISFDALAGRQDEVAGWYRETWQPLLRTAGLHAGHVYVKGPDQLMELPARQFCGIYRTDDWESAAPGIAVALARIVREGPIDPSSLEVGHYRSIIPRLTAVAVISPLPEARAREQSARLALGDRQHRLGLREARAMLAQQRP